MISIQDKALDMLPTEPPRVAVGGEGWYIPSRLEAPDRPQTSKQYAQIGPMAPRDRRPGKTNRATPCRHLSLVLFRAFPPRAPNAGQWNNTG